MSVGAGKNYLCWQSCIRDSQVLKVTMSYEVWWFSRNTRPLFLSSPHLLISSMQRTLCKFSLHKTPLNWGKFTLKQKSSIRFPTRCKKISTNIKEWLQSFFSSVDLPLSIGGNCICSHNFEWYFPVKTATDLFCWKNCRRESISKKLYQLKWANCTVYGGVLAGAGLFVSDTSHGWGWARCYLW